ncbi:MAG TPA: hypothetical protein VKR06_25195 [Ktedonosporobacter sp.]|nr:hypothetical protein [Ktedonosporobacter sp.]
MRKTSAAKEQYLFITTFRGSGKFRNSVSVATRMIAFNHQKSRLCARSVVERATL